MERREPLPAGVPILILGGSGLLGRCVAGDLERRGLRHESPGRDQLDLAGADIADAVRALEPPAVINAAAYTDVTAAERPEHRDEVYRLNRDAPGELARACRRLGAPLIHVSTDYVFDGAKREPYRERDEVRPLQVYGASKLEGERAVLEAHPDALVVRTSTLFGPREGSRLHYVDAVLGQAKAGAELRVVRLPVSSPTYAPDLACGLIELLLAGASGLVHLTNDGACSRLELARETVELAGLGDAVEVHERPRPSGELLRPDYSVLDNSWFTELTGGRPRTWRAALREYVTNLD